MQHCAPGLESSHGWWQYTFPPGCLRVSPGRASSIVLANWSMEAATKWRDGQSLWRTRWVLSNEGGGVRGGGSTLGSLSSLQMLRVDEPPPPRPLHAVVNASGKSACIMHASCAQGSTRASRLGKHCGGWANSGGSQNRGEWAPRHPAL
eukprot:350576-Chlamydomonas_euryale.AAC.3